MADLGKRIGKLSVTSTAMIFLALLAMVGARAFG